jgi:hypothetical protein
LLPVSLSLQSWHFLFCGLTCTAIQAYFQAELS